MGYVYSARFSLSTSRDELIKLKLKSYDKFLNLLDEYGLSINDYASHIARNYDIELENLKTDSKDNEQIMIKRIKDLNKFHDDFISEFKKETKIDIALNSHDSREYGDSNDDIDGHFYDLNFDTLYKLTDDANRLSKIFPIKCDSNFVSNCFAISVIQVTKENIEILKLRSFDALMNRLNDYKTNLNELAEARSNQYDIYIDENVIRSRYASKETNDEIRENITNELNDLLDNFFEEFKNKTNLSIDLSFHNSEIDGDCFDDIDGNYFYLDFHEVYKETEEAKRLKERIEFEFSHFVTCE